MREKIMQYEVSGTATITIKFKDIVEATQDDLMEAIENRINHGEVDFMEVVDVENVDEIKILNKWQE